MSVPRAVILGCVLLCLGCNTDDTRSVWDGEPDGSLDSRVDADSTPDPDVVPNRCRTELDSLIAKESYAVSSGKTSVGWEWVASGQDSDATVEFEGTFNGTASVNTVIDLECPAHAEALGLTCSTSELLMFQTPDGTGSTTTESLAVPLPLEQIDLPEEGAEVEVTVDQGRLTIREAADSDLVLYLGGIQNNAPGETRPEVAYTGEFAGLTFDLPAAYDDPQAATCVTPNLCPRIIRLEPLEVTGSNSQRIHTGASGTVTTQDGPLKVWNVLSYRRNDAHVEEPSEIGPDYPGGYCADITAPSVRVIVAPAAT